MSPVAYPTRPRASRPARAVAAVAAALTLLLPTGVIGIAHAADAAPAVKVAIATDIDTFNPFLAILASSTGILRFQYENLVQYGTNNEAVPGLSARDDYTRTLLSVVPSRLARS